jgi:GR25 family glycosyltransferase involved in LPS biosynthesis
MTETTYDIHRPNCKECREEQFNKDFDNLWSFVPQAYCISLKDREDRAEEATQQFHRVGLCNKVLFVRPSKDKTTCKRPGTRGCWESHRFVAKLSLEGGFPFILVFEDDVLFDKDITPQRILDLKESFNDLPSDWNAYQIGHWSIASVPYKKGITRTWSLCTHSYFMNKPLMQWIFDHPFDNTFFSPYGGFGIDCYLATMRKVYGFFPMLAYQSGSKSSNAKPKLGGKILDMALSDPKYMKWSQYTGMTTSFVIIAAIVALTFVFVGLAVKKCKK